VVNANGTVMKRLRLTIASALALTASCAIGSARGDDLPREVVARPATLPHEMVALTLTGGYDNEHVLGIRVLSATHLGLAVQRGMTSRLEMSLATAFAVHPDPGWTRDGAFGLAYRAWQRDTVDLAPSLIVPLSFHSGADLTSTIVLGAGLHWHVSRCVLLTFGQRLLPLPIRPAVAFDVGADAAVAVQLAPRWAVIGQALLGEVTIVGQTDRGVAPWHHLASVARVVYATDYALDVAFEVHGDARDPRNQVGFALEITRRM
jgi:hypothetical protein